MKSPSLRTILDALQGPPGMAFPAEAPVVVAPTKSARPVGTPWKDRVSQSSRRFSYWWNSRTTRGWRDFFKVFLLAFWVGVPTIVGIGSGIVCEDQHQTFAPFAHHYQIVLPFFTAGHYLGWVVYHIGIWMAQ